MVDGTLLFKSQAESTSASQVRTNPALIGFGENLRERKIVNFIATLVSLY